MKSLLYSVVLAVLVFEAFGGTEQPCYKWNEMVEKMKESCDRCMKHPNKPKVDMCVYKAADLLDSEGNMDVQKARDAYLNGLDENKHEAVRKAVEHCGKDETEGMKTTKEIKTFWKCGDKGVMEVCPEMKEEYKIFDHDEDLKKCYDE